MVEKGLAHLGHGAVVQLRAQVDTMYFRPQGARNWPYFHLLRHDFLPYAALP
jgi:hypothetical protein